MTPNNKIDLSIVIPGKNESYQIGPFFARLTPILESTSLNWEILFVNDGSTDDSLDILLARRNADPRIGIIDLSRNFGKEAALSAGMHHAKGSAVITMDADGQHQPEMIPKLIHHWHEGFEMVISQRINRRAEGWARYLASSWFYRIFNLASDVHLIPNGGDYRLFDRKAVDAYKKFGERNRFNKGLFSLLGFKQKIITHPSEDKGEIRKSRWGWKKLFGLAFDAFFSFSKFPIRVWTCFGFGASIIATCFAIYIVYGIIFYGREVPGYASLLIVTVLMGGVNMVGIGILGEYIGRVFTETQQRPLYIISSIHQNDD